MFKKLKSVLVLSSLILITATPSFAENFFDLTVRRNLDSANTTVSGNLISRGLIIKKQLTPAAKTAAATITVADMLNGIVTVNQVTGATVALTVDTGAKIQLGLPRDFAVNDSFDFVVINTDTTAATNTATLTAATGVTLVGAVVVPSSHSTTVVNSSMRFRVRKTATNTFVIYRV